MQKVQKGSIFIKSINKFLSKIQISYNQRYNFSQSGNLYTWGRNTSSLGYQLPNSVTSVTKPKLVADFDNNVKKVSMGYNHSAVITEDGNLYTFGSGRYGSLGHNDGDTNHALPKLVEFFAKNNLKVVDVQCGETHTICLTEDGDVWTWGYGGRSYLNFLVDLMFSTCGPLGHGNNQHRYTPTPIQTLRNLPPIKKISCGYNFGLALNVEQDLFIWGRGDYGVFGNGSNNSLYKPILNDYFKRLKDVNNLVIKELKSANNYSVALLSDGNLYGWGSNEAGQMGIKSEIGFDFVETAKYPTLVVNQEYKDKNVVGFDLGEDIMAILLDTNEVLWSGMRLEYAPAYLKLPKDIFKIKQVTASYRCLAVLTEDNQIFMKNKYVDHKEENIETGIYMTDNSIFENGDILQIGGTYRNRFAIVKN